MYGIRTFSICVCIILCTSCSPAARFHRLVTKYPYLLDSSRQDKIVVRNSVSVDTQIVWQNKIDTLVFRETTIERRNDTFRIYYRERPCTTFIQRTEVRPSKVIERYFNEKDEKQQAWAFLKMNYIWLIVIIALTSLLLTRK